MEEDSSDKRQVFIHKIYSKQKKKKPHVIYACIPGTLLESLLSRVEVPFWK
jgi:hypothetical protein